MPRFSDAPPTLQLIQAPEELRLPSAKVLTGAPSIFAAFVAKTIGDSPPVKNSVCEKNPSKSPEPQPLDKASVLAKRAAGKNDGDLVSPAPGSSVGPGALASPASGSAPSLAGGESAAVGYLRTPKPVYPQFALKRGMQGRVLLAVTIDKSGWPAAVELKKSSGWKVLDDAAIEAVKEWEFTPARASGQAVGCAVIIPVQFTLTHEQLSTAASPTS